VTFPRRTRADPLLRGTQWTGTGGPRAYWLARRGPCRAQPCKFPGAPIDYDGPYWVPTTTGRVTTPSGYTINLLAYHCGHIVSRSLGKRLGWTAAQINALGNTRPEHAGCSVSDGGRLGGILSRRGGAPGTPPRPPVLARNAHRW